MTNDKRDVIFMIIREINRIIDEYDKFIISYNPDVRKANDEMNQLLDELIFGSRLLKETLKNETTKRTRNQTKRKN